MEEIRLQLAATSDIHWPQYKGLFIEAVKQLPSKLDLFLLGGDLVFRGNTEGMQPLINTLESANLTCPIYAVFGNDDYDSVKDELKQIADKTITFLDDEMVVVKIRGKKIAIVGSRGVLDQPTYWQARNISDIRERYTQRVAQIDKLLGAAGDAADFTILLTHYTPTYTTLRGEVQRTYAQMGSRRVEKLLTRHTPTLALHGHAHRGRKRSVVHGITGKVPVYNISLPLTKRIVTIEVPRSLR